MSKIEMEFIKSVYPEMTDLAMISNNDQTCLKDATLLISTLRRSIATLESQLAEVTAVGREMARRLPENSHANVSILAKWRKLEGEHE